MIVPILLTVLLFGCERGPARGRATPDAVVAETSTKPPTPSGSSRMDGDQTPTVTRAAELPALDGADVVLRGVYRQRSLPIKKGGAPRMTGTVAIELEGLPSEAIATAWDGQPMLVQLGVDERPADEIERLRDQRVEVRGTLVLRPPPASPVTVAQSVPGPRLQNPGAPTLIGPAQ